MLQGEIVRKSLQGKNMLKFFGSRQMTFANNNKQHSVTEPKQPTKLANLFSLYFQGHGRSANHQSAIVRELMAYGIDPMSRLSINNIQKSQDMLRLSQQTYDKKKSLIIQIRGGYLVEIIWRKCISEVEAPLYTSLANLYEQYAIRIIMLETGIKTSRSNKNNIRNIIKFGNAAEPHRLDNLLFMTFQSFLDSNLSITETARQLKLHRNTVLYRLNKIKNMTGLDPIRFAEAVLLSECYQTQRCKQ